LKHVIRNTHHILVKETPRTGDRGEKRMNRRLRREEVEQETEERRG